MKASESLSSENLDYKHHNIIKTITNLPVHFLLKLYQVGVWILMVWILTKFYTVFGNTSLCFSSSSRVSNPSSSPSDRETFRQFSAFLQLYFFNFS